MATETKRLSMIFATNGGSDVTLSVDEPLADLQAETVKSTMEDLAQLGIFVDKNDLPISTAKGAKITTTMVQELF